MAIAESDVIFWLELDGDLTDASGNTTWTNTGASVVTDAPSANWTECYEFVDSQNDKLNSNAGIALGTHLCTVAMWVKINSLADGNMTIFAQAPVATDWNWQSVIRPSLNDFTWGDNGGLGFWSPGTLATGTWYHLVMTTTSTSDTYTSFKAWWNGSSLGNATNPIAGTWNGANGTAQTVYLGGANSGTADFTGRLSQVAVFNRVLTDAEVTDLYNSGSGKTWNDYFGGGGAVSTDGEAIMNGVTF